MNWARVMPLVCGYERVGETIRLYVEGPVPAPDFTRLCGVRTNLFRLFAGEDAESLLAWLARNRVWQCLRVPPPYTREQGVRAILIASDWHCGERSATFRFARDRVIADEVHRQLLQREVRLLIDTVLENPVREGEFESLQLVEDVANTAPVGEELATPAEIVDGFFGSLR